jgi:hypothetical protein
VALEKDGDQLTERARNEEELHKVKKDRNIVLKLKVRTLTVFVTSSIGNAF